MQDEEWPDFNYTPPNIDYKTQWDEKGYFVYPGAAPSNIVGALREVSQSSETKITDDRYFGEKDGRARTIWSPHWEPEKEYKWLEVYARSNPTVPIVKELLGGDLYINQLHFNYKLGNGGGKFNWHSDYTVFKYHDKWKDMRGLSVFFLLDDMNETNGNFHFAPGSHKVDLELEEGFDLPDSFTHAEYGDNPDHDRGNDEGVSFTAPEVVGGPPTGPTYNVESVTAKAGDALIFHSNVWHMSPTNDSPFDRRTFCVCYNHIDNKTQWPITNDRKEWMTLKDFTPI